MVKKRKILFWGELPPKIFHGISLSNKRILEILSQYYQILIVEDASSFRGGFCKLYLSLSSYLRIMVCCIRKIDVFYFSIPLSRFGLFKAIISVQIVRIFSPKAKIVGHLHRGDFPVFISMHKNRSLFTFFSKYIDHIFTLSPRSADELLSSGTVAGVTVSAVYNTIDLFNSDKNLSFVGEFDYVTRRYYCLCNYIESKCIHSLVFVANQLSVYVDFNGTVSSERYFNRLIRDDIKKVCSFEGVINGADKEFKLKSAKALILPSRNEGMPLVLLESLSQGTPVICFDVGYISDYLGCDYPGLIQDYSDHGLMSKIKWLDSLDPEEYMILRKRSFDLFWDNYSPERINISILKLFDQL